MPGCLLLKCKQYKNSVKNRPQYNWQCGAFIALQILTCLVGAGLPDGLVQLYYLWRQKMLKQNHEHMTIGDAIVVLNYVRVHKLNVCYWIPVHVISGEYVLPVLPSPVMSLRSQCRLSASLGGKVSAHTRTHAHTYQLHVKTLLLDIIPNIWLA